MDLGFNFFINLFDHSIFINLNRGSDYSHIDDYYERNNPRYGIPTPILLDAQDLAETLENKQ